MSEYSFHLPKPDRRRDNRFDKYLRWFLTGPDRIARLFCNEDVYQEPLDGHGISYLGELIGQYDNLGKDRRVHNEAEQVIKEICNRSRESDQIQQQIAALQTREEPKARELKQNLKSSQLTWDDLLRFESALLQVFPEKQLRRRALSIRDEFHEVAGENAWNKYVESKPPDPAGDLDVLRADTEALLSELHWLYVSEPVQECQRARLLFTILFGMFYMLIGLGIVLTVVVSATAWWSYFNHHDSGSTFAFPLIVGVMFAGALGGSFSSLLRLQHTAMSGNAVLNLWKLDSMGVSAILSPFVGALSATLLLFLFSGHFVEGQLFPRVSLMNSCESWNACSTNTIQTTNSSANIHSPTNISALVPSTVITNLPPVTNSTDLAKTTKALMPTKERQESPWPYHFYITLGTELAKLLIWCFIAGFSERLVPDIIDRISEKSKS